MGFGGNTTKMEEKQQEMIFEIKLWLERLPKA